MLDDVSAPDLNPHRRVAGAEQPLLDISLDQPTGDNDLFLRVMPDTATGDISPLSSVRQLGC